MPIRRNIVAGVADSCRAQHIPTDADPIRQSGVRWCHAREKSPPSSREFSCRTTTCRRLRRSASRWPCGHRVRGKSISGLPSRAPWQFPPHSSSQRSEKINARGRYAPVRSCDTVTSPNQAQVQRCAQQKRSRSSFFWANAGAPLTEAYKFRIQVDQVCDRANTAQVPPR